jgi:hypothetical protein
MGKIMDLTLFERACLEIWCRAFWEQNTNDDLEARVAELAEGSEK